jgi:predicted Zn-dependent protease
MNPNFPLGHWYLGVVDEQRARFDQATVEFQTAVKEAGGNPSMLALLGHVYALAGKTGEAEKILWDLNDLARQRYVPPYPIAAIYVALGRNDDAIAWLQKAFEERDSWMDYLGTDPRMDRLRSDPRFAELLRDLKLPL